MREREIVQLLAEGKSNKEVAGALSISVRTAETHRSNVLRKLSLDSLAGLVRYAIRRTKNDPDRPRPDYFDRLHKQDLERSLVKRLEKLGNRVTIEPVQPAA